MNKHILSMAIATLLLSGCGSGDSDDAGLSITGTPELASSGLPFQFSPVIAGAENNSPAVTANDLPAWLSFNAQDNSLTGTPTAGDIGVHTATLVVNDGTSSSILSLSINVESGARYDRVNAKDFYAYDIDGAPRQLDNNLQGSLRGKVQFAQSHTIDPNNNYQRDELNELNSKYMPDLVAERQALLLFTPELAAKSVQVEISIAGEVKQRITMRYPNQLFASDYNATDGRSDVTYSAKAWNCVIPWNLVTPGLAINFITDAESAAEQSGELTQDNIDFAAPAELVVQSIRLGMLTPAPVSSNHYMLEQPAQAGSDYFQTIPVARLILGSYASMQLDSVIIASGDIYTDASSDEGSVYSGDMRENVAKSQVSTGINLANFGITSNNMRQSYPHVFKQNTIHHAAGNYANGVQGHGLSGGNGIATLYSSRGNELSHEFGHAYGLGHYPGSNLSEDNKWAGHHADSGWGYIAQRNRMRANLHWKWAAMGAVINGVTSPYLYQDLYSYNRDAMSSGEITSKLSAYTHHTGYSARIIQQNVDKPIPDLAFGSGYKKWDKASGKFMEHEFADNAQQLKPTAVGVQVTTLLGGYDPGTDVGLVYPTFEGNYGNLFALPAPAAEGDACWLAVNNTKGELRQIALAASRHDGRTINQFHVNLAATYLPTSATLNCRINDQVTELASQTFSGTRTVMADPVIIGKERGYQDLFNVELPVMDAGLQALTSEVVPMPSAQLDLMLASYSDAQLSALSVAAKAVKATLVYQTNIVQQLSRLLVKYEKVLTETAIQARILGWLDQKSLLDAGQTLITDGDLLSVSGRCLTSDVNQDGILIILPGSECNSAEPNLQWFRDARGAIHASGKPELCLSTGASNQLSLVNCDPKANSQRWQWDEQSVLHNAAINKCLDYDRNNVKAIMYGCHGGSNQRWTELRSSDSLLLTLLPAELLQVVLVVIKQDENFAGR